MRTEQIKIYKFDELSDKSKETAIANNHYINLIDGWYEYEMDNFHNDVLEKYGVDIPLENFRFTGFCSQGDGASFTVDFTPKEIDVLLSKLNFTYSSPSIRSICENNLDGCIERIDYQYYHKYTVQVNIDNIIRWNDKEIPAALVSKIDYDIERIQKIITVWKNDLCDLLYKNLEDEYDYLASDEAIREALIANECEFLEGGTGY